MKRTFRSYQNRFTIHIFQARSIYGTEHLWYKTYFVGKWFSHHTYHDWDMVIQRVYYVPYNFYRANRQTIPIYIGQDRCLQRHNDVINT